MCRQDTASNKRCAENGLEHATPDDKLLFKEGERTYRLLPGLRTSLHQARQPAEILRYRSVSKYPEQPQVQRLLLQEEERGTGEFIKIYDFCNCRTEWICAAISFSAK